MSTTSLGLGEIVHVEVREASGAPTAYSHDYPVDASRLLRIPSLSPVLAEGKPLSPDLRDEIDSRFSADGILSGHTVNVALSGNRVDLENPIQPGQTLFLRLLNPDGSVDPSSGSYAVDGSGTIHMPFLGGVLVRDHRLFEAEHQIEQGLLDGGFFTQPLVNVTRVPLA